MDLDELIITWFCWIDDGLQTILEGQRLRQRGPDAMLHDSEALTMEVIGEYLGLEQDTAILAYFRRLQHHIERPRCAMKGALNAAPQPTATPTDVPPPQPQPTPTGIPGAVN
jgi:hypothetical protein